MKKTYKIVGILAHGSKPKKDIDFVEYISADSIGDVKRIYFQKLRGVKKTKLQSIRLATPAELLYTFLTVKRGL